MKEHVTAIRPISAWLLTRTPNSSQHRPRALTTAMSTSTLTRTSLRALASSAASSSRPLPYRFISATRFASSVSESIASSSSSSTTPLLPNQPPVVEPALPTRQTPPPAPTRPARTAPRIKSSKAALILVRPFLNPMMTHVSILPSNQIVYCISFLDIGCGTATPKSAFWADATTHQNRRTQQGVCRHAVPP